MEVVSEQKKAVLILGAPRSGTSVTTGVMGKLGLNLGHTLTEARSWNPRGDYEDANIVDLNRSLIRAFGICPRNATGVPSDYSLHDYTYEAKKRIKRTIKKSFGDAQVFGLKHPRINLMLPVFLDAVQEMGYHPHLVVVSRDTRHVVRSLNRSEKQRGDEYELRDGLRFVHSFLRPLGKHVADYPHTRITFNEITQKTPQAIEKIRKIIPGLHSYEEKKELIDSFVYKPKGTVRHA